MFSNMPLKKVASLKSLLLYWLLGSGIVIGMFYAALLEGYFRVGITLKSQLSFELFVEKYISELKSGQQPSLPDGIHLKAFRNLSEMTPELKALVAEFEIDHKEMEFLDWEEVVDNNDVAPPKTGVCGTTYCQFMFLYPYKISTGEWLYLIQGIVPDQEALADKDFADFMMLIITFLVIMVFGALALILVNKISQPVEQLSKWADTLSIETTGKAPEFEYQELNQVADHLLGAFLRIKESIEKEQRFLQQVSHELRTPIATASGNIDILTLTAQQSDRTLQEQTAISRIGFAITDMQQITETLLWLNRDESQLPDKVNVSLSDIVQKVVSQNQYLLQHKQVKVKVSGEDGKLSCYETLCHIVIANLIRNAFQYTHVGEVNIKLDRNGISVHNEDTSQEDDLVSTSLSHQHLAGEYGFGLGLSLVQQIADRLNWKYQFQQVEGGWNSHIEFS